MAVTLTVPQKVTFTIAYTDVNGNAVVPAAGSVTITDSTPATGTLAGVDPTGTTGTYNSVAAGADALVATGPSGVIPLSNNDITVVAAAPGPPAAGAVTFGTPA